MKKFKTFSLILLAVLLAVSAVACSAGSKSYKIVSHIGNENLDFDELQLKKGNSFSATYVEEGDADGANFKMVASFNGKYKTSGDTLTCTLKSVSVKLEFPSAQAKSDFLEALEEYKDYMEKNQYEMYRDAAGKGYSKSIEEMIEIDNDIYTELVFKINKSAKTAVLLKETYADGESSEYEYYDEATGAIKKEIYKDADGDISTWEYTEDGDFIYD